MPDGGSRPVGPVGGVDYIDEDDNQGGVIFVPPAPPGVPQASLYVDRPSLGASFVGDVVVSGTGDGQYIPIIYGRRRVVGHLIAAEADQFNNITAVWNLCEGEITAAQLLWDGSTTQPAAVSNVVTYLGSDTQAVDALLALRITGWTTSNPGRAYVRAVIDPDQLTGGALPSLTAIVDGRAVYDPRTTLTAFSTNPVLALRDYLTDVEVGMAVPAAEIDDVSFNAIADWADELIAGGTRWRLNIRLAAATSEQAIRLLLEQFWGYLSWWDGKFRLEARREKTADATLVQDDFVTPLVWSRTPWLSRPNRVRVHFTDPTSWDPDSRTSEDGTVAPRDVIEIENRLEGCTDADVAQRWASLQRLVLQSETLHARVVALGDAYDLLPGDRVDITTDTGLTAQPFRVMTVGGRYDGGQVLTLEEYAEPLLVEQTQTSLNFPAQLGVNFANPDSAPANAFVDHIEYGDWSMSSPISPHDLTTSDWTLDAGTRTYLLAPDRTEFGINPAIGGDAVLRATFDPGAAKYVFLSAMVKVGTTSASLPLFSLRYRVDGVDEASTLPRTFEAGDTDWIRLSMLVELVTGTTQEIVFVAEGPGSEVGTIEIRCARAADAALPGLTFEDRWTWDQVANPDLASSYLLRIYDEADTARPWAEVPTGSTSFSWGTAKGVDAGLWNAPQHRYEFGPVPVNGSARLYAMTTQHRFFALPGPIDEVTSLKDQFLSEALQTTNVEQPSFATMYSDTWTAPVSGTYIVEWFWEFSGEDGGNEPACSRLIFGGTELTHAYYGAATGGTVTERWMPATGRSATFIADHGEAFPFTVELAKAKTGGYTASIRRIRIHVWRVGT